MLINVSEKHTKLHYTSVHLPEHAHAGRQWGLLALDAVKRQQPIQADLVAPGNLGLPRNGHVGSCRVVSSEQDRPKSYLRQTAHTAGRLIISG